jgi:hypothetical protein
VFESGKTTKKRPSTPNPMSFSETAISCALMAESMVSLAGILMPRKILTIAEIKRNQIKYFIGLVCYFVFKPNSSNWLLSIAAGASIITSLPELFFGNAIKSRMVSWPPRNNSGRDVMIDAPAAIDNNQLDELGLKTK